MSGQPRERCRSTRMRVECPGDANWVLWRTCGGINRGSGEREVFWYTENLRGSTIVSSAVISFYAILPFSLMIRSH